MKLIIAEKPSVAAAYAAALGAKNKKDGYLEGNGCLVTWCIGHLVSLAEAGAYEERYKKWNYEDLPILPEVWQHVVSPGKEKQFSIVKSLMERPDVTELVNGCDAGREGELIFRLAVEMAGCTKPVWRLWISSMEDTAIREGFSHLEPGSRYEPLYHSALCRSKADWLIGINATRLFSVLYHKTLNVGRVQTPTLAMLAERDGKIMLFQKKKYYHVRLSLNGLEAVSDRVDEKEKAVSMQTACQNGQAVCVSLEREKKTVKPPKLYDLTTLQREANRLFGFTAKETLDYAQALYEKKLLTYPRTDSRYLSHDMLGKVQTTLGSYDGALQPIGEQALSYGVRMTKRVFDDAKLTDHHAIIPTGKRADRVNLTADERRLYEMVAKRLAAAFYPNYEYDALRVVTTCGEDDFLSTGKAVTQEGWKAVYGGDEGKRKKKADDDEQRLPALAVGDERLCRRAQVTRDQTKPPKEYSDASILLDMEHAGRQIADEEIREQMKDCALGTPATRAAIIERLIDVGYVRRSGKNLVATGKGVHLIEAVPPEIASPETTGRWERALAEIARGSDGEARFRQGIARLAAFLVENAAGAPDVAFAKEERRGKKRIPTLGVVCPVCGQGKVAENSKGFYCTRFREGCRFTIWKDALTRAGGPMLTAKLLKLCMEKKDVRGSTGTIHYNAGQIRFEAGER